MKVMGIHTAMLPTGKVMFFSYPRRLLNPANNRGYAWLWDPSKGTGEDAWTDVKPPMWTDPADGVEKPANIWCAGQSFLADGRLLVTGGNLAYDSATSDFKGLNKVYTFNPWSETWTEQPDMRDGRWYPSQVLMPDGRTMIMAGLDSSGARDRRNHNPDIELFTPSPDLDGVGRVDLIGARDPTDIRPPGSLLPPAGGYYPHLFWMPSGRILVSGQEQRDSWYLNNPGPLNRFSWTDAPNLQDHRTWGTAVQMPTSGQPGVTDKIWQIGGGYSSAPNTSTEIFDESDWDWTDGPSLNMARSHHNTVILPDGGMVTVGGGYGVPNPAPPPAPPYPPGDPGGHWSTDFYGGRGDNHRKVELWDRQTGAWRYGAKQAEPRAYHSTAVLLPDGRVLSAGDDKNTSLDNDTAEIYTPPNLLTASGDPAPRPTIQSAPAAVRWNATFGVRSPSAISRAVLMAPSAVTHSVDMNQRHVELEVINRVDGKGVNLRAPDNPNTALPGLLHALPPERPRHAVGGQVGSPEGRCSGRAACPRGPAGPAGPARSAGSARSARPARPAESA